EFAKPCTVWPRNAAIRRPPEKPRLAGDVLDFNPLVKFYGHTLDRVTLRLGGKRRQSEGGPGRDRRRAVMLAHNGQRHDHARRRGWGAGGEIGSSRRALHSRSRAARGRCPCAVLRWLRRAAGYPQAATPAASASP